MELWIRSQNKLSLTKANSVIIDYNDQKKIVANYMEFNGSEDYTPLGEYDTEERTLEVLNEIQKHIARTGQGYVETDEKGIPSGVKYYGNIYEMPKE